MVDTPQVVHQPIGTCPGQVAAAIDPLAVAVRIRDETLGRQRRPVQVTPRHTFSTQVELTGQTQRQQVQVRAQYIGPATSQQGTDRCVSRTARILRTRLPQQGRDHRLGRSIAVEQVVRAQAFPGQLVAGLRHRVTAEAVHPHRRRVAVTLGMLGQLLQVHRRKDPDGHTVTMHLRIGLLRQPDTVVAHQHPRSVDQRVHPAFMGTVEGERHEMQLAVRRARLVALAGRTDMRHQRSVGYRHALGQAGRTGGVDHVGQVFLGQIDLRRTLRTILPFARTVHRQARQAGGQRQTLEHVALGQHQRRAAILQHVAQALGRIGDVQRHVGAAGLEYGQERHHDLRRTAHGDGHPHLRTHAQFHQALGQAIGLAVEFAIAQPLLAEQHRNRLRRSTRLLRDQLVDERPARIVLTGLVPAR
ncbi:hypothetical protein PAERUG_P2_London_28_IMP_1_06_05_02678 [Pseudomonas aeruginosa]|nr:hypothetical protein PAERUG_P2_London_28_IMP_1_06_05_02678 [Pseudomonas aeruginosa]